MAQDTLGDRQIPKSGTMQGSSVREELTLVLREQQVSPDTATENIFAVLSITPDSIPHLQKVQSSHSFCTH